jgi:hypothetical protein
VCVERPRKIRSDLKKVIAPWSIDRARLATAKLAQVARSNKRHNAGVADTRIPNTKAFPIGKVGEVPDV